MTETDDRLVGDAVWEYLEVLEVDPDNATARKQVGRVATAVRQFDQTAPARRWQKKRQRQNAIRRWLSGDPLQPKPPRSSWAQLNRNRMTARLVTISLSLRSFIRCRLESSRVRRQWMRAVEWELRPHPLPPPTPPLQPSRSRPMPGSAWGLGVTLPPQRC